MQNRPPAAPSIQAVAFGSHLLLSSFPALRYKSAHCATSAEPFANQSRTRVGALVISVSTESRLNRPSRLRATRTFIPSAQLAICSTLLACTGPHPPASLQLPYLRGLIAMHLLVRLPYNLALEWLTSSPLRSFDPLPHTYRGPPAVTHFCTSFDWASAWSCSSLPTKPNLCKAQLRGLSLLLPRCC